jgi:hypothetical protein
MKAVRQKKEIETEKEEENGRGRAALYLHTKPRSIISISKDIKPSFGDLISLAIAKHIRNRRAKRE